MLLRHRGRLSSYTSRYCFWSFYRKRAKYQESCSRLAHVYTFIKCCCIMGYSKCYSRICVVVWESPKLKVDARFRSFFSWTVMDTSHHLHPDSRNDVYVLSLAPKSPSCCPFLYNISIPTHRSLYILNKFEKCYLFENALLLDHAIK